MTATPDHPDHPDHPDAFWRRVLREYEAIRVEFAAHPVEPRQSCCCCLRGYPPEELIDGICQACIAAA